MSITINGSGAISGLAPALIQNAQIGTGVVAQNNLASNVSSNGPCFSAGASAGTSCGSNVFTKIAYQTKEFDTHGAYDNTSNYRFQPLVAGYYQVNFCAGASSQAEKMAVIYKNGSLHKAGTDAVGWASAGSILVYLNGSTDYVEVYFYHLVGSTVTTYTGYNMFFQANFVRSA